MVDLGLDMAWALPEMRAAAESRMVDRCTVTKAGEGKGPWNEATMQYDAPDRIPVYEGRCEVQRAGDTPSDSEAASGDWSSQQVIVKLPVVGSEDVARRHVVRIESAVNDPALVDREFTVDALAHKSWATARRLRCTEGI